MPVIYCFTKTWLLKQKVLCGRAGARAQWAFKVALHWIWTAFALTVLSLARVAAAIFGDRHPNQMRRSVSRAVRAPQSSRRQGGTSNGAWDKAA